jgi:peptidoglycan-N-acetylglucosamine deacetylase
VNKGAAAVLAVGTIALAGTAAHLTPAVASWRQARNLLLPKLAGIGHRDHVALTFDDGPDPASTPEFLDELDALGWKATFFMLGSNAVAHPDLVTEVAQRGHEVAVHGYTHANHLWRGSRWTAADFSSTKDTLARLSGSTPRWARPPYGALSASSLAAAHKTGLRTVLWTTWGRDWRGKATPESIIADVATTFVPGATVLLHDSDCTSATGSWKATLASLPLLAERWSEAGLRVGTLAEHGIGA